MKKKRKMIEAIIKYLIDTDDKDVINHYTDMIMDVFNGRIIKNEYIHK